MNKFTKKGFVYLREENGNTVFSYKERVVRFPTSAIAKDSAVKNHINAVLRNLPKLEAASARIQGQVVEKDSVWSVIRNALDWESVRKPNTWMLDFVKDFAQLEVK